MSHPEEFSFLTRMNRLGDVIDGLLSMSLIKTASKVSGGLDPGYRNRMVRNIIIEVSIGLIPLLGDFIDTFFQANTRNVVLLEAMLTARVKKLQDSEKVDHIPSRDQGRNNEHQRINHARTPTPPEYDDRHAGVHKRLQMKDRQEPASSTQPSGSAGGNKWLSRLQSRGKPTARSDDVAPDRPPRPAQHVVEQGKMGGEDVAPARPPRNSTTRHQQVGSF